LHKEFHFANLFKQIFMLFCGLFFIILLLFFVFTINNK